MIQSLFSCFPGAIGRLLILQHEDFKEICKFALECYLVVCVDWCHRMSLNLGTWKFSRKFISMFTIRSFAMPNFSSIYLQCHPPVRESANSWMLHYFICVRIYDHAIELFNYLFLFYFSELVWVRIRLHEFGTRFCFFLYCLIWVKARSYDHIERSLCYLFLFFSSYNECNVSVALLCFLLCNTDCMIL